MANEKYNEIVKGMSAEDKRALAGFINNDLQADELTELQGQLDAAKTTPERVALKRRMCAIQNGR